ncbi:MAG: hypothetical protein WBE35_09690, partial [Candidatus Cybelea sp.]
PRVARRFRCLGGRRGRGLRPIERRDGFLRIDPEEARVGSKEAANVDRRADRVPPLILDGGQLEGADADFLGNVRKRQTARLARRAKPLTQRIGCPWHLDFELAPP